MIKMELTQKHKEVFRSECNTLSQAVLGSLLKLAANPKDKQELSKLVQSADTIMGDARFLQDKELEQNATEIVKSFTGTSDVRKKIDQFGTAFEQFGLLVGQSGACPKGYILVNGKCVMDTKSSIKSKTILN
jgi:chemotaxis protein histidine kinase CheA